MCVDTTVLAAVTAAVWEEQWVKSWSPVALPPSIPSHKAGCVQRAKGWSLTAYIKALGLWKDAARE